jgi:hypothetical protein
MAKKKQLKKHKFKYSAPASVTQAVPLETSESNPIAAPTVVKKPVSVGAIRRSAVQPGAFVRDFSYVTRDLRRIGILAVCLVVLELLLSFLFGHTALGNAIYHSVQA